MATAENMQTNLKKFRKQVAEETTMLQGQIRFASIVQMLFFDSPNLPLQ